MAKIWVKRNGRVATVFLNDDGSSMPIAGFDDAPLGFPYTANVDAIKQKYAGHELVWVDRPTEAQPDAPPVSDEEIAKISGRLAQAAVPQASVQVQPLPAVDAVLQAFKDTAREVPEDLEAVGSFILRIRPDLEEALRAALAAPAAPAKRFKL